MSEKLTCAASGASGKHTHTQSMCASPISGNLELVVLSSQLCLKEEGGVVVTPSYEFYTHTQTHTESMNVSESVCDTCFAGFLKPTVSRLPETAWSSGIRARLH